jgi:hypothetical protein
MERIEADLLIPGNGEPIRDGVVVWDGPTITYAGPAVVRRREAACGAVAGKSLARHSVIVRGAECLTAGHPSHLRSRSDQHIRR